jgi:hypothetical protein
MSYLKHGRRRHSCVTDGHTYVYVLGGDGTCDNKKVERYDVNTRAVVTMDHDAPFKPGEGLNMAVCFQNTGAKSGLIYVLTKGKLYVLPTNGPSTSERWQELAINYPNKEKITDYGKQGLA